jgi:hypothetical protein
MKAAFAGPPCSTTGAIWAVLRQNQKSADPFSTHSKIADKASNIPVPTPPPQWNIPGTIYRRKKSGVADPMHRFTFS